MVADKKSFSNYVIDIKEIFKDADAAGYNAKKYDIPLIKSQLAREGVENPLDGIRVYDAYVVFKEDSPMKLENAVKTLEAEIGKELKYVWFDTNEFTYRVSMYDKLIRDVLDFPHEKILNRLNVAN